VEQVLEQAFLRYGAPKHLISGKPVPLAEAPSAFPTLASSDSGKVMIPRW
jgi:hypothetical protein